MLAGRAAVGLVFGCVAGSSGGFWSSWSRAEHQAAFCWPWTRGHPPLIASPGLRMVN